MQARKSPVTTSPKPQSRRRCELHSAVLRFAPLAWLKLRLFLHAGDTEVGFFGISAEDDLLYVQDLFVPKQTTSSVTVQFHDVSVADYFEDCAEKGIAPVRCGRVWIHTHPGDSPTPSNTDEGTFGRVFGSCDWAIMAIVARGGATYARMSFSAGPGGAVNIPVAVDWESLPQELLNREGTLDDLFTGWIDEYGKNVFPEDFFSGVAASDRNSTSLRQNHRHDRDVLDELYDQEILDENLLDERIEQLYLDSIREEAYS
jgi:hypothetical protein